MVFDRSILTVGRGIQDFGLCDFQGVYRNTAKLRAKGWLAIFFFNPADANSAKAAGALQNWTTALPGDKVTVLGVGIGAREEIEAFAKDKGITFPVVWDYEEYFATLYSLRAVPTIFVTNAGGKILAEIVGAKMDEIDAAQSLVADAVQKADEAAKAAAEAKAAADAAAAAQAAPAKS